MARQSFKYSHCLLAVTLVTGAMISIPMTSTAVAQSAQDQLSQAVATLLANNPQGGDQLAQGIHDLVLANPDSLPAIIAALKATTIDGQKTSIGTGLGKAAQDAVQANNQKLASDISIAVAGAGVQLAVAAFQTAAGDATIASINSAAGSPGGGGGGGGPTNSSAPQGGSGGGSSGGSGSNGTNSGSGTLTGGGSVGGSSGSSQTASVSPR